MATVELPPVMTAPGLFANETVCYPATMVTTNGFWSNENPFLFSLPMFLFQNLVIVITNRLLHLLLKPFHTTRTVCEILCGILWGRSLLSRLWIVEIYFFHKRTIVLLETMGNIGVIYFLFTVGLEMDISIIKKYGKKSLTLALAGMLLPLLIASAFSYPLYKLTSLHELNFTLLYASALGITALPVLTRTLGEFRLLGMEIGELAKSAALINEIFGVALLVFAVTLASGPKVSNITPLWIILSATGFLGFCILILRPVITWLVRRKSDEVGFGDFTTSVLISGLMLSGAATDAIGVHPMFGAFVFGLIVPHGVVSVSIVEQLEDFVTGLMLPLFFFMAGMKTDLAKIGGFGVWFMIFVAIVLGSAGKIAGTVLAALSLKMPFNEGVALGLLMNTKGLIILLGLGYGKDQKVIDDKSYSIMVVTTVIINAIITPTLIHIYKPARKSSPYNCRTVQQMKGDSEFRILTCIHNPRSVPTIINLLEASYPSKSSPISAFSLHLVEQTGHGASLLVSHGNRRGAEEVPAAVERVRAQTEDILNAFDTFERNSLDTLSVQAMTGVAEYSVMHEQISEVAEDKRVSLVIVPFHKQQTADGGMESTNPQVRTVNQSVLGSSPCSVAILVDRGLGGTTRNNAQGSHNIAVLFFGGPDDREALAFALRMSEHPSNTLNVIRFIPGAEATNSETDHNDNMKEFGMLAFQIDRERDKMLDDEFIKDLKMMKLNDSSFSYIEKVVNNGDETVAAIRSVDNIHDIIIVGRSEGAVSSLTTGLTEWSECPELGVIGDLLASADFAATVSVLVVQQYTGVGHIDDGFDYKVVFHSLRSFFVIFAMLNENTK